MQEPKVRYGIKGMTGTNYAWDGCVTDAMYKHNYQLCFVVTNIGKHFFCVFLQASRQTSYMFVLGRDR